MNNGTTPIWQSLAPPLQSEAAERRMRRYLTVILATAGSLSVLAFFVNADIYSRVYTAVLVVYCVIGSVLLHIGYQTFLRIATPFVCWLVFTGLIFSGFGIHSVSVSTLPLLILIGALLGGRRLAYLYTTLSVITLLLTWLGEQRGFINNGMAGPSTLADLFNLYIINAFILTLIIALMRHVEDNRMEAVRNERRLNLLSSNMHDMVWTTDLGLNIEFVTPSVENILGYTPDELIGTSFADLMPKESFAAAQEMLETELDLTQRGLAPEPFRSIQTEVRCKDGTVRWLNARVSFLHDDQDEVFGTVGSAHDVSEHHDSLQERDALETQLHQAQRMESLGQFAGGIVHDFNNILVAIQGYSDMLQYSPDNPAQTREFASEIQQAADRASGLTRQLLNYGRNSHSERNPFGVNTVIEGLRGMLQRLLPENIRFECELDHEEPIVDGVPGQFEQLLMNLALNARDAMPDGGVLRLESRVVQLGEDAPDGMESGRYARIRVSDTGFGIAPGDLDQIFDPFFSTKDSDAGTGLGMSVVKNIVDQHAGHIDVASELSEGTTVTIHFPVAIPDRRDHSTREQAIDQGGSETILLVEDNLHVQHVVSQLLSKAGYNVLTASNGREGIAVYERHRNDIAVVLSDLVMPEMGGHELLQQIRALNPHVPILFTSGYTTPGDVAQAVENGEARLIQKPYRPTTLLRFIRATLDQAKST